jgi:Tfp pilus assembly protein PilF
MKSKMLVKLFFSVIFIVSCLLSLSVYAQTRTDEVPMYGESFATRTAELKAADEKFIADVTQHYGSREKAGRVWVEQGYKFDQQDKYGLAMRRFNQAWLLDPTNPEVYAGFGSVLHDQGKSCEAMQMMEKSLSMNPPQFQGIYPDAARIITLCAINDKTLSAEAKDSLIARSEVLYKKAEEVEPNKKYIYGSWATAYFWRGQYAESWAMVAKERALGGNPGEKFLGLLRGKMAEPVK